MQYPHWLMVAGAVLVVVGFIGLYFVAGTLSPIKSLWKMRRMGNEMPSTDSTSPRRLRKIIWAYDGSQICIAEVDNEIDGDPEKGDPFEAGIIKELIETATDVRILTQNRREPIDISASLATHRFYFEDEPTRPRVNPLSFARESLTPCAPKHCSLLDVAGI